LLLVEIIPTLCNPLLNLLGPLTLGVAYQSAAIKTGLNCTVQPEMPRLGPTPSSPS
jgi:hypothetical protein